MMGCVQIEVVQCRGGRQRRVLLHAVVAILVVTGLLAQAARNVSSVAHAATTWSGGSAAGSGQAPWEPFHTVSLGGGTDLNVNLANGNLLAQTDGLDWPGINGMDVIVAPMYNSRSDSTVTDLGNGWVLGTGRDVGLVDTGSSATFYDSTGRIWTFAEPSSCTFTAPPGIDATLKCVSGGYTLTENASQAQMQFNSAGYLTALQNQEGNRVTFAYNASNLLASITNNNGQVTTFTYGGTSPSEITSVTTAGNRVWSYGYDSSGNLASITSPGNHKTQFFYDSSHRVNEVIDPNGNITLVNYDTSSRVSSIERENASAPVNPTWTYTYNSGSTQVKDPNSHTTTYGYDSSNRLTSMTLADGTTTYMITWSSDNHPATIKKPSGATTTYTYDSLNNLTEIQLPSGATETWTYGNSSFPYQPSASTGSDGISRSYTYTSQGLLASSTQGSGIVKYAYNSDGTVQSYTDENNNVTTYGYTNGLLSSAQYPSGLIGNQSVSYNGDNLPGSSIDAMGQTAYTYDADGNLTAATYPDGSKTTYSYDPNGNETGSSDVSSSGTTTRTETDTFNALDQETKQSVSNEIAGDITYTYDGVDNLLTRADRGGTTTYGYDVDDRPSKVTDPLGNVITFGYNADSYRTSVAYPGSAGTESATYNADGNVTSMGGYTYSYTNPSTNQPTTRIYSATDATVHQWNYTYNSSGQLTQAARLSGGVAAGTWTYAYDAAGNMTSEDRNGTSQTMGYNAVNELTKINSLTTYSYDKNGNWLGSGITPPVAYNSQNQTTSIKSSSGTTYSMTYNGAGQAQRSGMTNGTFARFDYDADGTISATESNNVTTYYTRDPDGNLLEERVPNGSSYNVYYYYLDGQGSVYRLVNSSGTVENTYNYDPYGNALTAQESVANPFRFVGAVWDSGTGLYAMGERYYDPTIGRFTQVDPAGGDYSYGDGNPINEADPSGLCPACVVAAPAAVGLAIPGVDVGVLVGIALVAGVAVAGYEINQAMSRKTGAKRSHFPRYSSKKKAYEAAKRRSAPGQKPMHHPHDPHGPHYHAVDKNGKSKKNPNIHYKYPPFLNG